MDVSKRIEKSQNGLRIAIFAIHEMGHFLPVSKLGDELASRGHKVNFVLPKGLKDDPKINKIVGGISGAQIIVTEDTFSLEEF